MGKSSLGPNIGTLRGKTTLETGLAHDMIGAGKQCKLKEDSRCKDRTWSKIREGLCSKQQNFHLSKSSTGGMFRNSKYGCKVSEFPVLILLMNGMLVF